MSKWYKASELERLNTPMPMDGVNGLPDNHVITVSERVIEIDESELVQNNVSTDTFTLELDAEWDDITPVVIFSNSQGDYKVAYENGPTKIPAAAMAVIGAVDVSVFGLDSTGEVRVVTKAAPNTMDVVASGKFVGQVSSDDVSLLGQILQAVSDANTAAETANTAAENAGTTVNQLKESVETFLSQSQTSVDNAVSSAGTATSAANTAAQTANTAADNADKSADTADAAATKANTSASRAENAYTTLQPILADISVSGNQPRKTLSGKIVSAKDAWPAKPLGIRVKGKTRQNLWVNPSGKSNGVTFTNNDDGSLTVTGTSSANIQRITTNKIYTFKPNASYTLSVSSESNTLRFFGVRVWKSDNTSIDFVFGGTDYDGVTRNFVAPSNVVSFECCVGIPNSGITASGTYRVMLNEGSEAEPWCPPGLSSVDELSVVTTGKNLINTNGASVLRNNFGIKLPNLTLQPGSYVVKSPSGLTGILAIYRDGDTSSSITSITESGRSFTITSPLHGLDFRSSEANQITLDNISQFQLELGSTATAYEPPNITTTPIDRDGNSLRSLPDGTCDELVITADGTCQVERRLAQRTIDAEHPISIGMFIPASGTNLPYVNATMFTPFDSYLFDISNNVVSTSWPFTENLKSRGVYRTWNSIIFVDERFTDKETAERLINETGGTFIAQIPSSTEPQSPVILPVLPAPTFNIYHDADVPSDTSVEYTRDINIALADLEAKIADLVTKEAANV